MSHMLRVICVFPIRVYQRCISPVLPPACRYYPTCSAYAAEAVFRADDDGFVFDIHAVADGVDTVDEF